MFSLSDQLQHASELFKVLTLCCSELILSKERNDLFCQIRNRSNTEAIKMLLVIIGAASNKDPSTFKKLFEIMQCLQALSPLSYDELREDLPARSRCCFLNGYREATFSVNKAYDPSDCS